MATVKELLDQLADGKTTVDEVAADFRSRVWKVKRKASKAEVYGVVDTEPADDDNDWELVNEDARLTPEQYQALSQAKRG